MLLLPALCGFQESELRSSPLSWQTLTPLSHLPSLVLTFYLINQMVSSGKHVLVRKASLYSEHTSIYFPLEKDPVN